MIHIENFKNNKIFNELNKNPDSRKYSCKIFMSRDIFREIDPIFLSSKRISLRFTNDRETIHLGNNKPGTCSIGNQVNRLKLKFDESRMNEKTERVSRSR